MIWLGFIACVLVILITGSKLARYGDVIAEKTGMGRAWVGVVLLAAVTSLPELITGISSVAIFDVPDIALGDIFGSCMFNLLIIALLDLLERGQPVSARVHEGQALGASFGVLLLSTAAMGLAAGDALPTIGWIGPYSLVLLALYALAMRMVFDYEKGRIAEFVRDVAEESGGETMSLATASRWFGVNAAITVAAALFLPAIGSEIAVSTGLTETFVGNAFIALSTSLPELVVAVAAVRVGAADMAVGNIFGSNLFNMAILAIDDIAYTKGPLLAVAADDTLVPVIGAIGMTAIATAAITSRVRRKRLPLAWDSVGIVVTYAVAIIILL